MTNELLAVAADLLVAVGVLVTTLGVYGMYRMPDVYTQLHSASKAAFLGIVALLLASLAPLDGAIAAKALLTGAFVLLTTPVAAHAVARAAHLRGESMRTPGAVDESAESHGDRR